MSYNFGIFGFTLNFLRFVKYDKALRQAFAEYEVNAEEGRLSAVTQLLDFAANHDNELNIAANENLEDEVWGESSESEEV